MAKGRMSAASVFKRLKNFYDVQLILHRTKAVSSTHIWAFLSNNGNNEVAEGSCSRHLSKYRSHFASGPKLRVTLVSK